MYRTQLKKNLHYHEGNFSLSLALQSLNTSKEYFY